MRESTHVLKWQAEGRVPEQVHGLAMLAQKEMNLWTGVGWPGSETS